MDLNLPVIVSLTVRVGGKATGVDACGLFVHYLELLAYRLLVDMLEYLFREVSAHAAQCTLCSSLVENLCVASGLQHSHVMLFLVLSYLAAYSHALRQYLHELVVKVINLFPELVDTLCSIF